MHTDVEDFFFKSTSGEEDVISLEIPMYNKGICLVTSISLHPKQLFVSDTQSFFQAWLGKNRWGVSGGEWVGPGLGSVSSYPYIGVCVCEAQLAT